MDAKPRELYLLFRAYEVTFPESSPHDGTRSQTRSRDGGSAQSSGVPAGAQSVTSESARCTYYEKSGVPFSGVHSENVRGITDIIQDRVRR